MTDTTNTSESGRPVVRKKTTISEYYNDDGSLSYRDTVEEVEYGDPAPYTGPWLPGQPWWQYPVVSHTTQSSNTEYAK